MREVSRTPHSTPRTFKLIWSLANTRAIFLDQPPAVIRKSFVAAPTLCLSPHSPPFQSSSPAIYLPTNVYVEHFFFFPVFIIIITIIIIIIIYLVFASNFSLFFPCILLFSQLFHLFISYCWNQPPRHA